MSNEHRLIGIVSLFAALLATVSLTSPEMLGTTPAVYWTGMASLALLLSVWGLLPWLNPRKQSSREAITFNHIEIPATPLAPMAMLSEMNPDPVLCLDEHGRATLANPAAERVFSTLERPVIGATLTELVPAFSDIDFSRLIEDEQSYVQSATVKSCFYQFTFRGVRSCRTVHVYATDLSERRAVELQLSKALHAAQAAAKAKSEFLATMSHEIRTPMNGIMGMTELLIESGLTEDQNESARIILSSADALLAIINDILDFSKIEAGKLELENIEFDLRSSIEEIGELFAPRVQGKGLELPVHVDPELPAKIVGDPTRLRQIITNLVSNAVKFTERGEIRIAASLVETDSDLVTLRIDVTDTGIGIPKDRQEQLFNAFSQADTSTTRKYGGTGLGLAICKELAEAMGGLIAIHSTPGMGSTFSFGARFRRPQQDTYTPQISLPTKETLRVLLCTSNETNQRGLRTQFANWRCETLAVNDPDQALELVRCGKDAGTPFHIMMLDYDIIGAELSEFVTILRRIDRDHSLGLILMTGVHKKQEAAKLELDLDGILSKPVKRDQLMRALHAFLKSGSNSRSARAAKTHRENTPSIPAPAKGCRILVVEDNPVNQKLALRMLAKGGHTAEIADHGKAALERLAEAQYDLILMDCQMPILDGYEATRIIRGDRKLAGIPIIGLTACAMKGDREKCLEAGMNDYLAKPYKPAELLDKVSEWTRAAVAS